MSCYDEIYGNDYYDFIVRNDEYLPPFDEGVCTLDGGDNFTVLFVSAEKYPAMTIANYRYNAIPKCYAPLSLSALDASGILQVRQTPALGLDGENILIGFLDSGIDTTHPAFLDEAGGSRVVAVWNQNYMEETETNGKNLPEVPYGVVYDRANMQRYGNGDESGHGTYVASVAAGSDLGSFSGAAPRADIAMVHLKKAKKYLKDYYFIPEDAVCYEETDLILGLQFLNELARKREQSLVICMSVGSAMGSHSGNSPLDIYLNDLALLYRRCVVCATGNQAAARRHFYGNYKTEMNEGQTQGTQETDYYEVEIVVETDTCGFVMEQWSLRPAQYQVSVISPSGEILPRIGIQLGGSQDFLFTLEGTTVSVNYSQPELVTGNQLIYYRFQNPSRGIWRVRCYPTDISDGFFHMYLAEQKLQCGNVFFLTSNPDTTITEPANASRVLTVGGYNQEQNAIFLESGRGYTLDGNIKPDLTAPAYRVNGAVAGAGELPAELQYEQRTGTSASVAITSGAAAMYLQWCNERGDYLVNTSQVKSVFLRGTTRLSDELYPNRQWGYGTLDLYTAFRLL